jgi:hypothetical protein
LIVGVGREAQLPENPLFPPSGKGEEIPPAQGERAERIKEEAVTGRRYFSATGRRRQEKF